MDGNQGAALKASGRPDIPQNWLPGRFWCPQVSGRAAQEGRLERKDLNTGVSNRGPAARRCMVCLATPISIPRSAMGDAYRSEGGRELIYGRIHGRSPQVTASGHSLEVRRAVSWVHNRVLRPHFRDELSG